MEDSKLKTQMLRGPAVVEPVFPRKPNREKNMQDNQKIIDSNLEKEYQYGFVTDIESETLPPGLNEKVIKTISLKKKEPKWLLDWRLKGISSLAKKERT